MISITSLRFRIFKFIFIKNNKKQKNLNSNFVCVLNINETIE